jgi:hypothetical protein
MKKVMIGLAACGVAVALSAPAAQASTEGGVTASKNGCGKKGINVSHHRGRCGKKRNGGARRNISH